MGNLKSYPFMMKRTIPFDVSEGDIFEDGEGNKAKITKIKKVQFIDMRTLVVIGLCIDI